MTAEAETKAGTAEVELLAMLEPEEGAAGSAKGSATPKGNEENAADWSVTVLPKAGRLQLPGQHGP